MGRGWVRVGQGGSGWVGVGRGGSGWGGVRFHWGGLYEGLKQCSVFTPGGRSGDSAMKPGATDREKEAC